MPNCCKNNSLNPALLTDGLQQDLAYYQRNWNAEADLKMQLPLWQHEWFTHGTCTGLSQYCYFEAVVTASEGLDVVGALQVGLRDVQELPGVLHRCT